MIKIGIDSNDNSKIQRFAHFDILTKYQFFFIKIIILISTSKFFTQLLMFVMESMHSLVYQIT